MNMELTPEEEGARLKALLGDRNKAQFAKENHVPGGPSMLSQHLSGHRPISLGAASAYARGLGVAVEAFSPRLAKAIAGASAAPAKMLNSAELDQSNITDGPAIKGVYPLISKVQAGMWTELCDQFQPGHADEWLPSTKNLGKCGYMLRVEGKSMENPGGRPSFADGMVLHVNPHLDPQPGNYVVVRREATQEATFKRYVMIDGEQYLEAINPDWPKEMKYLPLQPGDAWCGVVVDASLGGLI